jgi:hypothetical protein
MTDRLRTDGPPGGPDQELDPVATPAPGTSEPVNNLGSALFIPGTFDTLFDNNLTPLPTLTDGGTGNDAFTTPIQPLPITNTADDLAYAAAAPGPIINRFGIQLESDTFIR